MSKIITIPGIVAVLILFLVVNALPNETTTDTKSALKNAKESYKTDLVIDTTKRVLEQTSNQAIEVSCKDGPSQACNTTYSSLTMASIAFGILLIVLFVASVIGFAKWLINLI